MKLFRLTAWVVLAATAGAALPAAGAPDAARGRGKEQIVADLSAAPLPKVDVAAMADPAYAADFARRRDAARRVRAALIRELYAAAPEAADVPALLAERWQTLAQGGKVGDAVAEMSAYLAGPAGAKDKEAVAFQRADAVIRLVAKDTPARLAAVEDYRKFAPPEAAGAMVPQLLYRTGRLAPDPADKERLLARVVREYPDSQWAKVIRGATRRQEAVGKTMELAFADAVTGTPIDLADFRGKVVVLDFWASWCTDCAAERPYMKKAYADFKDKGVVFIGVSLDEPEADGGLAALKAGVERHQIKWPQYYLGKEWDSDFSSKWGVYSVPTVFVMDRAGRVVTTEGRGKLEQILSDVIARTGR